MERYTILLDWENQYCQNDYITQDKLQIKGNPYQTINGIFQWARTKKLQFVWKYKRYQIAKGILRRKHRARTITFPDCRLYYKDSHQSNMALAQKQKYRSTEQDIKPHVCVHVKSLQSCLTLCNPMDCSPQASSVHEILQTRIREWIAMPSSRIPNPGIKCASPAAQVDFLLLSH